MPILKTIKSWFKDDQNIAQQSITSTTTIDILNYMASLVKDKGSIIKEIKALPLLRTLSPENQRVLIPQLFERFETAAIVTQTKDELYKKLRTRFGNESLRKLHIPELVEGGIKSIVELEEEASEASQKASQQVGRKVVRQLITKYTKDNLLKGTVLDNLGRLDFSLAEEHFYKLPEQWLKLVEKSLQELIVGLDSLKSSVIEKPKLKNDENEQSIALYQAKLDKAFSGVGLTEFIEQGSMRDVSANISTKSGQSIPVALSGSVLKDSKGAVSAIVLAAKDLRQLQEYAKKRLSKITPVLQKIALGDFSEKIEIPKEENEFTEHLVALGLMTDDFKEMMEEIQQKNEEMEVQNEELEEASAELEEAKENLEEKVIERTAELGKAQEKFKVIFESSQDAMMTLEPPEWKFTSANPAALEIFGVKDEAQWVTLGPWDVSPEVQPDGKSSAEKVKSMISKAMEEGSSSFQWTHKKLNGDSFPVTVLLNRILEGDKTYLQATVRDLSELEKNKIELEEQVAERTKELEFLNKNLEDQINKRTQELQNKLLELERFNKVAVGRELKMVELKEEIARLKNRQ